ncbi:MAG: hypothetical protein IPQ13_10450 [Holophagaceae bacterium]|nr:hypothetical protein [Holophagaceae bacterium]
MREQVSNLTLEIDALLKELVRPINIESDTDFLSVSVLDKGFKFQKDYGKTESVSEERIKAAETRLTAVKDGLKLGPKYPDWCKTNVPEQINLLFGELNYPDWKKEQIRFGATVFYLRNPVSCADPLPLEPTLQRIASSLRSSICGTD